MLERLIYTEVHQTLVQLSPWMERSGQIFHHRLNNESKNLTFHFSDSFSIKSKFFLLKSPPNSNPYKSPQFPSNPIFKLFPVYNILFNILYLIFPQSIVRLMQKIELKEIPDSKNQLTALHHKSQHNW